MLAPCSCGTAPSVLFLVGLASCGSLLTEPEELPNVVLFVSDTHRWGAMSFTHSPHVETPNLERLKQQGVSLDRHYVSLPI